MSIYSNKKTGIYYLYNKYLENIYYLLIVSFHSVSIHTSIASPEIISEASIFSDNGFTIYSTMARLSGRAQSSVSYQSIPIRSITL